MGFIGAIIAFLLIMSVIYLIFSYTKQISLCEERREQNQPLIEEDLITKINSKIDKINELAIIINKTTNREEFYIFTKEIEDTLTELSEMENELDFPSPPSVQLKYFREGKPNELSFWKKG